MIALGADWWAFGVLLLVGVPEAGDPQGGTPQPPTGPIMKQKEGSKQ